MINTNSTSTDSLYDDSLMPFGEHKNTPMSEVPSWYLLDLWDNRGWHERMTEPLGQYIKTALPDLLTDCPAFKLRHPRK